MGEDGKRRGAQAARDTDRPGSEWRLRANDGDRVVEHANDGVFDELVVDQWLHLEQLDPRTWWARVGDARFVVAIGTAGETTVDIQRGFYGTVRGSTEAVKTEK